MEIYMDGAGVQPDDGAQVAENVEILKAYEDGMLLETLKGVLGDRQSLVQELVDWAVPSRAYVSSRLMTEGRATGRIKTFNINQGYGFIDCPPARDAFGCDVWLHHGQIGNFAVGDEVSFVILLGKGRKPQAFDLAPPEGATPMAAAMAAMASAMATSRIPVGFAANKPKAAAGPPAKAGGRLGPGSVGQASMAPGVAPTAAKFGGNQPGTKGGAAGSQGKGLTPTGKGIVPTGKGIAPTATGKGIAPAATGKGIAPAATGKGSAPAATGKGSAPAAKGSAPAAKGGVQSPSGSRERTYQGMVKSFSQMTGYGFIACEETKQMSGFDVYVLQGELQQHTNCQIGQAVTFTMKVNDHGKPQATEVWPRQAAGKAGGAGGAGGCAGKGTVGAAPFAAAAGKGGCPAKGGCAGKVGGKPPVGGARPASQAFGLAPGGAKRPRMA